MHLVDLTLTSSRSFPAILAEQVASNGAAKFLVTEERSLSFAEVGELTDHLAGGLQQLGVGRQDRVALMLGNDIEMVLLALAINKLGAIWTPINSEYKGEWLADNLERCRCKVLAVGAEYAPRIAGIRDRIKDVALVAVGGGSEELPDATDYQQLLEAQPADLSGVSYDYGDTCSILWTSGTTGKSKGVMQSYNCWVRAISKGASLQYQTQDGDVIYNMLPLYHSAAWITGIYRAMIEGVACVIEKRFSVTNFWERVRLFNASQTFMLGAMGVFLLNAPEQDDDADNSMRVAGVVPLSPDQRSEFERRFGVSIPRSGLGQSECLLVCTQIEDRADVPLHALGFPVDDSEVAILDDNGDPVADGETGEICVRPLEPHVVFSGYFDNPEATAEAYYGEWYRTGDLGRKDPSNGAFFFVDRKKDAIRYAGRNISTMEVESVAMRHPEVAEVAAFGIQSAEVEAEHELKLNVVRTKDSGLSHEALAAFINDNAPYYFVPRYMDFVDALPMTPTNKVQKFKLREAGVGPDTWDLKRSGYEVKR